MAVSKKTIETLEDNMIRKSMVHQPKHRKANADVEFVRTLSEGTPLTDAKEQIKTPEANIEDEVEQIKTPAVNQMFANKHKVLIVGDSITHNLNFRLLEEATNKVIHTAKAYSADFDVNARKPNKNVKYDKMQILRSCLEEGPKEPS